MSNAANKSGNHSAQSNCTVGYLQANGHVPYTTHRASCPQHHTARAATTLSAATTPRTTPHHAKRRDHPAIDYTSNSDFNINVNIGSSASQIFGNSWPQGYHNVCVRQWAIRPADPRLCNSILRTSRCNLLFICASGRIQLLCLSICMHCGMLSLSSCGALHHMSVDSGRHRNGSLKLCCNPLLHSWRGLAHIIPFVAYAQV